MSINTKKGAAIRRRVWQHYKKNGRHTLPWRITNDPYCIVVSEIMLQQTQVDRVLPYYTAFLARFPRVEVLAKAPLADVLRMWQGLGYNRRAKFLHAAAKAVVEKHNGIFPEAYSALVALPGIGDYTANAVRAFAYNADAVLIETNVRTVILHEYFDTHEAVPDAALREVAAALVPKGKSRTWHWALMDYGAYLKQQGVRAHRRSKTYKKQSTFEGSLRQVRGAVLRMLAEKPHTTIALANTIGDARLHEVLRALEREGLIEKNGRMWQLQN